MVRTSIFPSHFSRGGRLQRTEVILKIRGPANLAGVWCPRPPRAAQGANAQPAWGGKRPADHTRVELNFQRTTLRITTGRGRTRPLPAASNFGRQCNMFARAAAAYLVVGSLTLPCAATSEPDRPSWKAGHSVCHSFEGFQPTDLFPIRSPLVVADFLGPQLAHHAKCKRRPASPLSRRSLRGSSGLAARCCLRAALAFATHPGAWAAASLASGGSDCVGTLRRAARSARSARVTAT